MLTTTEVRYDMIRLLPFLPLSCSGLLTFTCPVLPVGCPLDIDDFRCASLKMAHARLGRVGSDELEARVDTT